MYWLVAWTILSAIPAKAQAPDPTALTCAVNGAEQCKDARFVLPKIGNDVFSKMFETRRPKFIEWIKPLALYIQGVTGLPASVFIAQAGLASEWGGSPAFRNNNNIFKHMCWVPKSTIEGEVQIGKLKIPYKGTCGVEKTFGNIGRPYKFATREESIAAYLHFVLSSSSKQYKPFQEELKRGLKSRKVQMVGYKNASGVLGVYSHDPKYLGQLQSVIAAEKISELDMADGCWKCLLQPKEAK